MAGKSGETSPLIGKLVSFAKAYPQIEDIEVQVCQTEDTVPEWRMTQTFNKSNIPQTVGCLNSRCQQGGFQIRQKVYFMVESHETEGECEGGCDGHEGSPKGRRKGDPCTNYFRVKIQITYKS